MVKKIGNWWNVFLKFISHVVVFHFLTLLLGEFFSLYNDELYADRHNNCYLATYKMSTFVICRLLFLFSYFHSIDISTIDMANLNYNPEMISRTNEFSNQFSNEIEICSIKVQLSSRRMESALNWKQNDCKLPQEKIE